jgi:hypothetical protein
MVLRPPKANRVKITVRAYYRNKLNRLLGAAGDEEFIQLLWATHALQSDYVDAARRFIQPETIPLEAITTNMISKFFIQKWEIETLANELMTVSKVRLTRNGVTRALRWDSFQASIQCINWLRDLETSEYRIQKTSEDIFIEMGRIAARQFDWQRGYVNVPQFYRNAFVYGQGECAAYFARQHGITINRFSQIGFMLFVSFTNFPVVRDDGSWAKLGVKWDEVERTLALIALPFSEAAQQARLKRLNIVHTADKPSILRRTPCLRFGNKGERIRAPLPELILERVTSGVFYDVVGGEGAVRGDYGKRFEEYCSRYLSEALPHFTWEREFNYRKKPHTFATPDILCSEADKVTIAIECKAARMSQEAMFGKNPMVARGYEDLTKAVFQLWRFFSHCRRGYVEREVEDEAVGVVLTLDNWLILAETLRERVLEDAAKMANEKDQEITEADRRPIVFVAVPELERTLSVATEDLFKQSLIQANSERFVGWRLDGILRELLGDCEHEKRAYPYAKELGTLLPWWDDMAKGDG